MKINWLQKLTSRKFWIALTDFVGMLVIALGYSNDTATRIVALIMAGAGALGYLIAEGLTDAAATKSAATGTPVILEGITELTEGTNDTVYSEEQ